MFLCVVLFHGLGGRRSRCALASLEQRRWVHRQAPVKAGDLTAPMPPNKTFMASFGGAWSSLDRVWPATGDGVDGPCLGSRVLVSGGSDAASLVWYDACILGADHSCPVTRSQWKEEKYLHSLIPVSKGGGLGYVAGVVDFLRRRRLSCWLAGWSDEGSEYQGTSSPVFNFFGRTAPPMTMLTVTSGYFRRSLSIFYSKEQPRAGQ
ncbi:hypothetical protein V494_06497 [Pseudogymnoascus sp. VKM F-4513 (FW-928)]|nr:hypothetical protein V494_06497 [Pseudogymnoascus sp. VKM F-4513 (FW-928)]